MSLQRAARVLARRGETRRLHLHWDAAAQAPVLTVTDYWCDGHDARTLLGPDIGARPEHAAELANALIAEALREGWTHARDTPQDPITIAEVIALRQEIAGPDPTPIGDALFP